MSQTTVKLHSPFIIFPEILSLYKPWWCLTLLLWLLPYEARRKKKPWLSSQTWASSSQVKHPALILSGRENKHVGTGKIFQQIHQLAKLRLWTAVEDPLTWELLERENGFSSLFFVCDRSLTLRRRGIHYAFLRPGLEARKHQERYTFESLVRGDEGSHGTFFKFFPQNCAEWLGKLPIVLQGAAISTAMRWTWAEIGSRFF